jgi:hypothetical protein
VLHKRRKGDANGFVLVRHSFGAGRAHRRALRLRPRQTRLQQQTPGDGTAMNRCASHRAPVSARSPEARIERLRRALNTPATEA